MELFSKRNKGRNLSSYKFRYRSKHDSPESIVLIKEGTRKRLHEQIKYLTSTEKYLERYFIVHDENKGIFFLYNKMVVDFSSREIGYDISDFIKTESLEFASEVVDDSKFFDFIEILIIFSQREKRTDVVKRLNKVFKEEDESFLIHDFMIVDTEQSGLRSTVSLIKDPILKKSLKEYYKNIIGDTGHEVLAKISAEILQRVCSSPIAKDKTKEYSEELCSAVAKKWTDIPNEESLTSLLSQTIKNSKDLSNQITNIRHTDQSTIPVDSPKIHKMIASKNMNIVELIVLTLPERFITEQNPDDLKQSYIDDYQIKTTIQPRIPKRRVAEDEDIDPKDIPF